MKERIFWLLLVGVRLPWSVWCDVLGELWNKKFSLSVNPLPNREIITALISGEEQSLEVCELLGMETEAWPPLMYCLDIK